MHTEHISSDPVTRPGWDCVLCCAGLGQAAEWTITLGCQTRVHMQLESMV